MSHTHIAHTYQFPSSPWASALDHCMVSVLRSRVGWASARNNEQTNLHRGNILHLWGKSSTHLYQISPNWCRNGGMGPKTEKFYAISEYKCAQGYILSDFYENCQDLWAASCQVIQNFGRIHLKASRVKGV